MNNLISWYNRNRAKIWITLSIIIAIFSLIQIMNKYYEKKQKEESSSSLKTTTTFDKSYSIVSEEKINEKKYVKQVKVIDNFFEYCNDYKISEAYNLLSENCKKSIYTTQESFENNYVRRIFTEKKLCTYQAWISYENLSTYKIDITEDILASGKVAKSSIEDYYTLVYEDNTYKLNISNYIGNQIIDKRKTQNNITFNIISKDIYMDYEIYNIEIKNNTENTIKLDSNEKTNSTYLKDINDIQYISYNHEILEKDFIINKGNSSNIKIKFNKTYQPNIKARELIFSDVILNYNEYINSEIKTEYNNRIKIEIDL